MALDMNDVAIDRGSSKRKFVHIENHGWPETEELQKNYLMRHADTDYVRYVKGCMSIADGPQHALIVKDVGDDSLHELLDEDDDPQYGLFLSKVKKHGSAYMLEADERIGLTRPLKYEVHESYDEGQEDLDTPPKIQGRESLIDDDYALFHDSLRHEGSKMTYQYANSPSVVYEGLGLPDFQTDNGVSSRQRKSKLPINKKSCGDSINDSLDLPNFQIDNGASLGNRKSKLSIHKEKSRDNLEEGNYSQGCNTRRKMCSQFRVQILGILSKPYDKEEHEKLMQEITVQKPQNRHLDLRSGRMRFYASDKKGKSYLDYHADLKRRIQAAAKHECKQLNLLRGFFFWIENLTQEGSFIPWNDKECLAVQPKTCQKISQR